MRSRAESLTPPTLLPLVSLTDLMQDALIIAKNGGCDVFNALDLMDSTKMLSDLKFGPGDGALQCVASHNIWSHCFTVLHIMLCAPRLRVIL